VAKNLVKKNEVINENDSNSGIRIQKMLAQIGVGSRREIERAIIEKRISVNNILAEIGQSVSNKDRIIFDGKLIKLNSDKSSPRILIYNKPEGEIVSESDPKGRATVFDHLPKIKNAKWISIGRLDFNTSGLLIFTSYGEFANRLMHPRYEIDREYSVRVLGKLTDNQISQLRVGIKLEDGIARFEKIFLKGGEGSNHWYQVILKEGRNREVRRLFEFFNIIVSRLMRVRFGEIVLPTNLKKGSYIELSKKEVLKTLSKFNINDTEFNKAQINKVRNRG
jgi:23S rRNA pseudouridine2605 synthase|tara:strand:+ start:571 stop:1407 length:837 start_codon:yes stop_codon:yes gene_type:complete